MLHSFTFAFAGQRVFLESFYTVLSELIRSVSLPD